MKKINKILIFSFALFVITPSLALASWWNPFSWNIFSFIFQNNSQTQITSTTTVSSQTPINNFASTTATTSSATPSNKFVKNTVQKVSSSATTQSPKVQVQTPQQTQPTGTLCNGSYWNTCPTGQNLICPQTGNAYCQLPQQPLQQSQPTSSPIVASTTINNKNNVDKGTPYQGQDGNWYYPNVFDANGKTLPAPTASIYADSATSSSMNTTFNTSQYSAVPLQSFNIIGKNDTFHLHSLTIHFTISGAVQVNTAYLYQGNTIPISSATVSNNIAVFNVPDGTPGASFGSNIPSQFTVKADVTGVNTVTISPQRCPKDIETSNYGTRYFIVPFNYIDPKGQMEIISPASLAYSINTADVQLYDSSNDLVLMIASPIVGAVQISEFQNINNICYDPDAMGG